MPRKPRDITIGNLLALHARDIREYENKLRLCRSIAGCQVTFEKGPPNWLEGVYFGRGRMMERLRVLRPAVKWVLSGPYGLGSTMSLRCGRSCVELRLHGERQRLRVVTDKKCADKGFSPGSLGAVNGLDLRTVEVPHTLKLSEFADIITRRTTLKHWINQQLQCQKS